MLGFGSIAFEAFLQEKSHEKIPVTAREWLEHAIPMFRRYERTVPRPFRTSKCSLCRLRFED